MYFIERKEWLKFKFTHYRDRHNHQFFRHQFIEMFY
jgi:hypothetical protein